MEDQLDAPKKPIVTRRHLLRGLVLAGLSLAGSRLSRHESDIAKKGGIEVDGILYVPIYDRHDLGPSPDQLTETTNALFLEGGPYIGEGYPAEHLLSATANISTGIKALIEKARRLGTWMLFGDVGNLLNTTSQEVDIRQWENAALGVGEITGKLLLGRIKNKQAQDLLNQPLANTASKIAMLDGISRLISSGSFPILVMGLGSDIPFVRALTRIVQRTQSLVDHLRRKNLMIEGRNAIFAYKSKVIGERLKSTTTRPEVAFSVGGAHSGTEDYLYLSLPVLRQIITALFGQTFVNLDMTQKIAFLSTRIIQVDQGQPREAVWIDYQLGEQFGLSQTQIDEFRANNHLL